jgi:hypothetical protein
MFSRTPRRLRLCTAAVTLAVLILAVTFVGQNSHSSPQALAAMQSTAYRVAVDEVPQQTVVSEELQAQSQARHNEAVAAQAAQAAQYVAAAQAAQQAAFLQAVSAAQQAQQKAATVVPVSQPVAASGANTGGWAAVAMCEEGGNDDPNYGYYGIKEWNGYDGYPTAGSAPQSVQLQWEEQNVGSPPDESGGCHSY